MPFIQLTHDKVAIVDDSMYHKVNRYKWHCERVKNHCCASRTIDLPRINSKRRKTTIKMHRFIYELAYGVKLTTKQHIDHIDGNPLNNSISNIRIVTPSQNMRNIVRNGSKTGYIGVYFVNPKKNGKPFISQISLNKKLIHLGMFDTAEQAANAYDNKYREIEGNELQTNFKSPLGWCFIEV